MADRVSAGIELAFDPATERRIRHRWLTLGWPYCRPGWWTPHCRSRAPWSPPTSYATPPPPPPTTPSSATRQHLPFEWILEIKCQNRALTLQDLLEAESPCVSGAPARRVLCRGTYETVVRPGDQACRGHGCAGGRRRLAALVRHRAPHGRAGAHRRPGARVLPGRRTAGSGDLGGGRRRRRRGRDGAARRLGQRALPAARVAGTWHRRPAGRPGETAPPRRAATVDVPGQRARATVLRTPRIRRGGAHRRRRQRGARARHPVRLAPPTTRPLTSRPSRIRSSGLSSVSRRSRGSAS